jgi:hypothetical protein
VVSGWRAALVAVLVGGVVLAIGWWLNRPDSPGTTGTTDPPAGAGVLACPPALDLACDGLAAEVGAARRTYTGGEVAEGTVVIAEAAALPEAAEPFARTPVAIAVWHEKAPTLSETCGGIDVACLVENAGRAWSDLGGSASWGSLGLGLADATQGAVDLDAWRLVDGAGPPAGFADAVRLQSADDGILLSDLVIFPTRADAVISGEAAIAGQLVNAQNRTGRLDVFYPTASGWVEYRVVAGPGRAADRLLSDLLAPELQAVLGSLGLRPLDGEATGLMQGLGQPGTPLPALTDAEKDSLIASWTNTFGG